MYAVYEIEDKKSFCTVWGVGPTAKKAKTEALENLAHYVKREPYKKHHKSSVMQNRLYSPLTLQECTKEFATYVDDYGGAGVFLYISRGKLRMNPNSMISSLSKMVMSLLGCRKLQPQHRTVLKDIAQLAEEMEGLIPDLDDMRKMQR